MQYTECVCGGVLRVTNKEKNVTRKGLINQKCSTKVREIMYICDLFHSLIFFKQKTLDVTPISSFPLAQLAISG